MAKEGWFEAQMTSFKKKEEKIYIYTLPRCDDCEWCEWAVQVNKRWIKCRIRGAVECEVCTSVKTADTHMCGEMHAVRLVALLRGCHIHMFSK